MRMIKLTHAVSVAALALSTVGVAHATDLVFTDGTPMTAPETRAYGNSYNLVAGSEVDTHGNTAAAGTGSFLDVYDFTTTTGAYLGSTVMETEWAPNIINITGLHASIFDSLGNLLFDSVPLTTSGLTSFTSVGGSSVADFTPAGAYKLEISGLISGTQGGSYAGTFTVAPAITTPVPEPEIYGMLASGLGIMAFVARRRKTVGTA